MIELTKSAAIPLTLRSVAVVQENQRLATKVAGGQNPTHKDFKSELYGASDVKDALLENQCHKCIFCECTLLDKDGGEVEHFRPKTAVRQDETKGNTQRPAYYQLAYDWENLSACCHACNRRKGTYFPLTDETARFDLVAEEPLLVNPYKEDPALHIEFRKHKIYAKSDLAGNVDIKGELTIKYLGLNRKDLLELRRRRLSKFRKTMTRQNLSFDEMLRQEMQDLTDDGLDTKSIEFLGMFQNQKYKF